MEELGYRRPVNLFDDLDDPKPVKNSAILRKYLDGRYAQGWVHVYRTIVGALAKRAPTKFLDYREGRRSYAEWFDYYSRVIFAEMYPVPEEGSEYDYEIRGSDYLTEAGITHFQLLEHLIKLDKAEVPGAEGLHGTPSAWAPLYEASDTWRLLVYRGSIVGYWNCFSLKDEPFVLLKQGLLQDRQLTLDMIEPKPSAQGKKNYKMFMQAMVLSLPHFDTHPIGLLMASFEEDIRTKARDGIFFSEVAAVLWTKRGKRFCNRIGMKDIAVQKEFPEAGVFYTTGFDIPRGRRRLVRGKQVSSLYKERFPEPF